MIDIKKSSTYRGKCIICGDSTVGKSALVQMFCSDGAQYPKTYNMTTGVDLSVKQVSLPDSKDTVEMFFYDTSGKDTYKDVVEALLHDAAMVIYVYDISNQTSFDRIEDWYNLVQKSNPDKTIPGVLIANKSDLIDRQVVESTAGEIVAEKLGLTFFQVSARDMHDTDAPFIHLARTFHEEQISVAENEE